MMVDWEVPVAPLTKAALEQALCVARGVRMTMKDVVRSRFNYDEVANAFRETAQEVGLLPCQLQSMLWFTWKRIHNVIYSPQLDAFRDGNQWATLVDLEAVKAFPYKAA